MRTQSPDTSFEAERVQIDLMRKAPLTKRMALMEAWSQFLVEANKQSIQQKHPNASKEEIDLIFVELNYGKKLADGLRADLAKRKQCYLPRHDVESRRFHPKNSIV